MELNVSITDENMRQAMIKLMVDEPSRKIIADDLRKYYGDKVDESMIAMGFTPETPEPTEPTWVPVKGEWVVHVAADGGEEYFTGVYKCTKDNRCHVDRPAGPRAGKSYDCHPESLRPATDAEIAAVLELHVADELVLWRDTPTSIMKVGDKCLYMRDWAENSARAQVVLPGGCKQIIPYSSLHLVRRAAEPKPEAVERLFQRGDVVEINDDGTGRALLVKYGRSIPGGYIYLVNSDGSHFWELASNLTLIRAAPNTD